MPGRGKELMNITGACFCGAVSYEAELDEARVGICHCRDCQIFSGSAFRLSSLTEPEAFRFTKGEPKYYDKRADSDAVRRLAFCGDCGTHLCSLPSSLPSSQSTDTDARSAYVSIRLSTAKEFPKLRPMVEVFCDSRVSWLVPLEGSAQFPRMPFFDG